MIERSFKSINHLRKKEDLMEKKWFISLIALSGLVLAACGAERGDTLRKK